MNRFAYANGNPVSAIDPFGTMAQDVNPNSAGTVAAELDYLNWALTVGDSQAANQARFALLDPNGKGFINIVSDVLQGNGSSLSQDQRFAMFQALAASGYAGNQIGWPGQEAAYFARNNPNASASDIAAMMNGAGGVAAGIIVPTANQLAKMLGVDDVHPVKAGILRDLNDPNIVGKNPDIGVDDAGNIVLVSKQTGKTLSTGVPIKGYSAEGEQR
ncbi:MAG TPA: hypothetical protein VKG78_11060 [Opitutaceae bacterium]|nr:hypothetical protein [Opitutaceae bacterium]